MARPVKVRCVSAIPKTGFFRPEGVSSALLEVVSISVEEAEAIRLRDLEQLGQEECARRMRISRPTFHRVLESARGKLASALIHGRAIQIEGGNFELPQRRFRCGNDGHEWNVPFDTLVNKDPLSCPVCSGADVQPAVPLPAGRGRAYRRRFRGGRSW